MRADRRRAMGNQGSAERSREERGRDGKGSQEKKSSFLNCQCGKGRDDKDEINGSNRGTKGTKLTEEEWFLLIGYFCVGYLGGSGRLPPENHADLSKSSLAQQFPA